VIGPSIRLRAVARAIPLAAALLGVGCGGEQAPLGPAPLVFSGAPAETVASVGGQASISIRWSWSPPVVGYDASELTITDGTGAPMTGLMLSIVPWMPAHGHGASVAPTVIDKGPDGFPGVYWVTPLDFYMSGTWQLLTTIKSAMNDTTGSINDTAQPSVDIP
jgi:hypothetical protein